MYGVVSLSATPWNAGTRPTPVACAAGFGGRGEKRFWKSSFDPPAIYGEPGRGEGPTISFRAQNALN